MLKIWFPGTNDTEDYGLGGTQWINDNVVIADDGKLGKCLSFNGSNSRLSTTNFELSNNWSFACWAKDDSSVTNWRLLIMLNTTGSDADTQMSLWLHTGEKRFEVCANGKYVSTVKYVPGQWNHFAATYDGLQILVYLNGVKVYTLSDSNEQLVRHNLTIGARGTNANGGHEGATSYFYGLVNDLRIWDNQVISPREIKELSKGLVLHYPLAMPGGENYLKNSNFTNGTNSWYSVNNSSIRVEFKDGKMCGTGSKGGSNNILGQTSAAYTANTKVNITVSAKIYVEQTGTIGIGNWISTAQATGWQNMSGSRVWHTDNYLSVGWNYISSTLKNATNQYTGSIVTCFSYTGDTCWITDVKLEFGDTSTPWVPNPADTAYSTLGFNDGIEYDVSGYGNNGTKSGTISYSSDTPRYNVSTAITAGSGIFTPIGITFSQYTIVFWAKHTVGSKILMGCCSAAGTRDTNWYWYGDNSFKYPSGEFYYAHNAGATNSFLNKWCHFAVTYDGSKVAVYRNGIAEGTKDVTGTQTLSNLSVGYGYGPSYTEDSQMSDFRIYATALSADDILELYHAPETLANNGTLLTQGEFVES